VIQSQFGILVIPFLEPSRRKIDYPDEEFRVLNMILHTVTENAEIERNV
jgi:hypothetical protein